MLFGEHPFVFTFLLTENLREIFEVTIFFFLMTITYQDAMS